MRKIIGLTLIAFSIMITGCSKDEAKNIVNYVEPEQIETTILNNDIEEEVTNNEKLSDQDIHKIMKVIEMSTVGTVHEGSQFKVKLSEKDAGYVEIGAIKRITDIMSEFGVFTADETVKKIRSSLVFDTVLDMIKNDLSIEVRGLNMYIYDTEEAYNNRDYYTLKSISVE